jgi:hypothetical protein
VGIYKLRLLAIFVKIGRGSLKIKENEGGIGFGIEGWIREKRAVTSLQMTAIKMSLRGIPILRDDEAISYFNNTSFCIWVKSPV